MKEEKKDEHSWHHDTHARRDIEPTGEGKGKGGREKLRNASVEFIKGRGGWCGCYIDAI